MPPDEPTPTATPPDEPSCAADPTLASPRVLATRMEAIVAGERSPRCYLNDRLPSITQMLDEGLRITGGVHDGAMHLGWMGAPLLTLTHAGDDMYRASPCPGAEAKRLLRAIDRLGNDDWADVLGALYIHAPGAAVTHVDGRAVIRVYKYALPNVRALVASPLSGDPVHLYRGEDDLWVHGNNLVPLLVDGGRWMEGMAPYEPPPLPEFLCSEPRLRIVYQQ